MKNGQTDNNRVASPRKCTNYYDYLSSAKAVTNRSAVKGLEVV